MLKRRSRSHEFSPVVATLLAAVLLSACSSDDQKVHDYQIVVNGSSTPVPVNFTGSYTFVSNGEELTRDLSGAGSFSTSLQAGLLKRVRVQSVSGTGLVSLSVYEDGRALFESAPKDASTPIIYTAKE